MSNRLPALISERKLLLIGNFNYKSEIVSMFLGNFVLAHDFLRLVVLLKCYVKVDKSILDRFLRE